LISERSKLTKVERVFLEPRNATHRQYEALRAYFIEKLPSAEAAAKFGYTAGSFRVLCHQFRRDLGREFFLPPRTKAPDAPAPASAKEGRIGKTVIELRKQNMSVYDISRALEEAGDKRSPAGIWKILDKAGFARLPRRKDDDRPPFVGPQAAEVADVRRVQMTPRAFRTSFGGLFLFLPFLAEIGFNEIIKKAKLPGSKMIPADCAMRSLLALKLFGSARNGHVMSHVFDEGLALFAGLNVTPKRSFLTEYSCRIDPRCYPRLMRFWFDGASGLGLQRGVSFDVDFHTIPSHGDDALLEKHYVSRRSRRQKGMLAFLAQDADQRVFCYANAEIRKAEQNDEIMRFVAFWKARTGHLPEELVFDSKLTTYANLQKLDRMGIRFITLRRRSRKLLDQLASASPSAWRRVELDGVSREYRTPRILDQTIEINGYDPPIRQIAITDLGHEEPTLLLTNQMRRTPKTLVERYAQRMLIENGIADGVDFFHMDALSSAVAMKVNCDLQLTLMGSSLYRLLGARIGNGYASAKSRHIFRDFVEAMAHVRITDDAVIVRFGKRAHTPMLLEAGFAKTDVAVPWWGGRRLKLEFGEPST
jgi:hypothetical protein